MRVDRPDVSSEPYEREHTTDEYFDRGFGREFEDRDSYPQTGDSFVRRSAIAGEGDAGRFLHGEEEQLRRARRQLRSAERLAANEKLWNSSRLTWEKRARSFSDEREGSGETREPFDVRRQSSDREQALRRARKSFLADQQKGRGGERRTETVPRRESKASDYFLDFESEHLSRNAVSAFSPSVPPEGRDGRVDSDGRSAFEAGRRGVFSPERKSDDSIPAPRHTRHTKSFYDGGENVGRESASLSEPLAVSSARNDGKKLRSSNEDMRGRTLSLRREEEGRRSLSSPSTVNKRSTLSSAPAVSGEKHRKTGQSLVRGGMILMLGLIFSKLSGQYREILYGNVFQESHLTDAYVRAFLIPDFIYDLLIGGSIQAAIIPSLSASLGTPEERKTWRSVSIFISLISLAVLGLIVLGELFAPWILRLMTTPDQLALTARMARTLFPQTFFMMLAALSIGIVNAHKKFSKTAFGPTFYNLCIIFSLYFFGGPTESALIRVGLGISFGAFLYFAFQYLLGYKELSPFRFNLNYRDPGFIQLLFLAVPTMFSASISQFSNMMSHAFTRDMAAGSSTALRYATSVWLLPYGIFTVGIGQAMLPTLSRFMGHRRFKEAAKVLRQSMRHALFFAMPSALIFFFLRNDIMFGIFAWGELSEERRMVIGLSADILAFFCIAIVFQSVIYIMNFAFYSVKKTAVPLWSGLIFLILMLLTAAPLARKDVMGAAGLSLSYAIASILTAFALLYYFKKLYPEVALKRMRIFFSQEVLACAALFLLLLCLHGLASFIVPAGKMGKLIWLAMRGFGAYAFYFYVSDLLYLPEPRRFLHMRARRIVRKGGTAEADGRK